MPIEIRELIIKVIVEERTHASQEGIDMNEVQKTIASLCKKEVKKQLEKNKER